MIINEVQNKDLHIVGLAAYPLPTFDNTMITLSAIDIVLSCLPALMLLAFIFLGYSAARDIAVRRNESEDTSRKNVAYYCKKLLTIGGIIFLFSFCCTGMIGYLHFVANDYFQITLMPGDFIELNNGNTSYSSFSETCDTLKYSRTPPYVLTPFDKMKLIYENHSHYEYCPNSQDLGFYKHSQQLPEYREQIHIFSSTRFPVMWFLAGNNAFQFHTLSTCPELRRRLVIKFLSYTLPLPML